jgi:phosphopantothenoylcysteine synthetase/decarboxylase
MTATGSSRVLYWIISAAPPAHDWQSALRTLQNDGWDPYVIVTETAAQWLNPNDIAAATGHAVRSRPRLPDEADNSPLADAVLLAPATFNTLNKWASGINDTLPLGLLNELMGAPVPIVVAPYFKAALASHPAYQANLELLRSAGVTVLDGEFSWAAAREALTATRAAPTASGPS